MTWLLAELRAPGREKRQRHELLTCRIRGNTRCRIDQRREERRRDHQRKNLAAPGISAGIERLVMGWHDLVGVHELF